MTRRGDAYGQRGLEATHHGFELPKSGGGWRLLGCSRPSGNAERQLLPPGLNAVIETWVKKH